MSERPLPPPADPVPRKLAYVFCLILVIAVGVVIVGAAVAFVVWLIHLAL